MATVVPHLDEIILDPVEVAKQANTAAKQAKADEQMAEFNNVED